MTQAPPLWFIWEGDCFRPKYGPQADKYYTVGERYLMVPHEDRSIRSHNHFFVSIVEAHANLPEHLAERFPSPDALRKYALIRCGYRDERSIVASSPKEAQEIAAFIRPMDEFAVVVVHDSVVTVYTAKSQSMKAMGKKTFGESKTAVLDFLSRMIGVERDKLEENAGAAT